MKTGGLIESKRAAKDMFSSICQANFLQTFEMPQKCELGAFPLTSLKWITSVPHCETHSPEKHKDSFSDCLVGCWASCCSLA